MKLKVSKFYRDTYGMKVHIWGYDPYRNLFLGSIIDGHGKPEYFTRMYYKEEGSAYCGSDIIEEWKEPRRNLYARSATPKAEKSRT
jgi:hypothetical protein